MKLIDWTNCRREMKEEKQMKKWFMIDSLQNGEKIVTTIDACNPMIVRFLFKEAWKQIPKEQQERRKAFVAYYCEEDPNGNPDLSTIQDTLQLD